MDPLSSFFTLANVYDPQKAQTNRMALDFGRQELEAGKLRNRVDTMALEQKVGSDALSLQAGRNALAQLMQNAQPAAGTVQNAAAQPDQAHPQQAPQVQNALYTPQGKQEDTVMVPGIGNVSRSFLEQNPQAYDAAARAASSYQQQQGQLATQQLTTTADELQKQVMSALKDNDQTKLDNVKEMVNGNPALQSIFRQNGMWSTVQSLKLGMGNTPHEVLMYMDADQIKRAAAVQGSPVSPNSAPGYYSVKYVSPQGTDLFSADTKIKEAKPAKLTDAELQDRAADGDKEAQRLLKNRTELKTEAKSKTPEQLRAVFTDPAKSKVERDKAWNDFKLSPLSTNQLMAISTDKTLSADQRKWAQDIIKKEDERSAQKTRVSVDIRGQEHDRQQKAKDAGGMPAIDKPLPKSLEVLAQKVANGEMAPSQLPKRRGTYEQILSRAVGINPELNLSTADANYNLKRNTQFRTRAMTAETLPEIMENMVKVGKKLNYSDAKFIGNLQKWKNGQLNDPTYTEYMTMRNDSLMTIASVMRGNGMTDMAHQAEVEAASPTMSPRALDAWMRAQKKALEPRLRMNREIIGNGQPQQKKATAAPRTAGDYLNKWR